MANRLLAARQRLMLTQQELATWCNVTQATISRIESDVRGLNGRPLALVERIEAFDASEVRSYPLPRHRTLEVPVVLDEVPVLHGEWPVRLGIRMSWTNTDAVWRRDSDQAFLEFLAAVVTEGSPLDIALFVPLGCLPIADRLPVNRSIRHALLQHAALVKA